MTDDSGLRLVRPDGYVVTLAPDYHSPLVTDSWSDHYLYRATAVTVHTDGSVFVVDQGGNRIVQYDAQLRWAGEIGYATPGMVDGEHASFSKPSGIAVRGQNSLWVSDTLNHWVRVVFTSVPQELPSELVEDIDNREWTGKPPRRTIPIESGRVDAWAGIAPALTLYPQETPYQGTGVSALYLSVDSTYLYWMMTVADGTPTMNDRLQYALTPYRDRWWHAQVSQAERLAKIENSTMNLSYPERWNWSVGPGFVQGRFPIKGLETIFGARSFEAAGIQLWRDGDNSFGDHYHDLGPLEF